MRADLYTCLKKGHFVPAKFQEGSRELTGGMNKVWEANFVAWTLKFSRLRNYSGEMHSILCPYAHRIGQWQLSKCRKIQTTCLKIDNKPSTFQQGLKVRQNQQRRIAEACLQESLVQKLKCFFPSLYQMPQRPLGSQIFLCFLLNRTYRQTIGQQYTLRLYAFPIKHVVAPISPCHPYLSQSLLLSPGSKISCIDSLSIALSDSAYAPITIHLSFSLMYAPCVR